MPGAERLPRLALVMVAVGDLAGSGGAERHFSDLFEHLRVRQPGRVSFMTSRSALGRLQAAGHLRDASGVIALPLGSRPAAGKWSVLWMSALMLGATLWHRFEIIHIVLPTPSYVPYFGVLSLLPRWLRPRLAINVIDCTLAHNLMAPSIDDLYERQVVAAHRLYFKWTRLDGIYTWYRAFAESVRQLNLLPAKTPIIAARWCFTDSSRFTPGAVKERVIVWAGRLSAQKRPLLFVEAAGLLRQADPQLLRGWRFEMYGLGILEPQVRGRIASLGLGDVLSLSHTPDMAPRFARSRLFVSTQAYENFTSLAMLEAMAAGNAVVAANVGQTAEFVGEGPHAILVADESAQGFADAMAEYLRRESDHDALAAMSRRVATEVHTLDHFAQDIIEFWDRIAA